MTKITTAVEAIDAIAESVNGEGLDKKGVKRLARYFREMVFKSPVSRNVEGVVAYWVGFCIDRDNPQNEPTRIELSDNNNMFGVDGNNRHRIQSAFVVPTRGDVTGPPLVESTLELENSESFPKVVITSQLNGCTFAIGNIGDEYFMSHAQPKAGETGSNLAQAIHSGPVKFQGNEAVESTFLIHQWTDH
ncbi:hypothetical protein M758_7G075000 [Ceratodon purpureus]|nr:hypothetical protein M758_7G075000 [Ceratodon purpureus]